MDPTDPRIALAFIFLFLGTCLLAVPRCLDASSPHNRFEVSAKTNRQKPFWQNAMAVIARGNSDTSTLALHSGNLPPVLLVTHGINQLGSVDAWSATIVGSRRLAKVTKGVRYSLFLTWFPKRPLKKTEVPPGPKPDNT